MPDINRPGSGHSIDLNSDMGESFGAYTLGHDAALLDSVSSANVACGFHGGDPRVMAATVALAREKGVAVGAHPSYPDLVGFGRREMAISPQEAYADLLYQLGALYAFCRAAGIPLQHVKPHGAIYNRAAVDEPLADALARAVAAFDRELILVGLPNSATERAARAAGIPYAREAFADRAYNPDGTLASRKLPGAVISDPQEVARRAVTMVTQGRVRTIEGGEIALEAETLCIHGDTPGAPELARSVRAALEQAGVTHPPDGGTRGKAIAPVSEPADDPLSDAPPAYRAMGDGAVLVEFANVVSPRVNRRVQSLAAALDANPPPGLLDLIPAYRTLLVVYDPLAIGYDALLERLRMLDGLSQATAPVSRVVTLPVVYGGEFGPDLPVVAAHTGLPEDEVIARHTAGRYLVYFLGFSPGFAYLGGLDPSLATPRLREPRLRVPAGSVGIAGTQTGVYPEATPGGWQLIGRTPLRLYDPTTADPFLLHPGDELRFAAIDAEEYRRLAASLTL